MSKRFLFIHFILAGVTVAALAAELVHFLYVYPGMPEIIGMHFDGYGEFDEEAEKIYGLYPYVMGGFLIGMLLLADFFLIRLKLGLDYEKRGEELIRAAALIATNGMKLFICLFFLDWSDAVIHQHAKSLVLSNAGAIIFTLFFTAAIVTGIYAKIKYKHKNAESEKKTDTHRLVRLYGTVMSFCEIAIAAVIWERFPYRNETTDPFAMIWFEDIHTNAPKIIFLIPIVLSFISVFIGDIFTKRFEAKGRILAARAADFAVIYSVTCCFFRMLIIPEQFYLDILGVIALFIGLIGLIELFKFLRRERKEKDGE